MNKSCKHLSRTFPLCLHTTKNKEIDAAETFLGFFGFDRTVYSNLKKGRRIWILSSCDTSDILFASRKNLKERRVPRESKNIS
jgi:hypothetical protein